VTSLFGFDQTVTNVNKNMAMSGCSYCSRYVASTQ